MTAFVVVHASETTANCIYGTENKISTVSAVGIRCAYTPRTSCANGCRRRRCRRVRRRFFDGRRDRRYSFINDWLWLYDDYCYRWGRRRERPFPVVLPVLVVLLAAVLLTIIWEV